MTLRTASPALSLFSSGTSDSERESGEHKVCATGPYLQELYILVEKEYIHRKYTQHWPLSIGGQSSGSWKWTLGRGLQKETVKERRAWKGALGRKGVGYSLSLILHVQSTGKPRAEAPILLSYHPPQDHLSFPGLSHQPPDQSPGFSLVCTKCSSGSNQNRSLLCPKACNVTSCPCH